MLMLRVLAKACHEHSRVYTEIHPIMPSTLATAGLTAAQVSQTNVDTATLRQTRCAALSSS